MRILLLDIETSPNLVWVWGFWQQNVAPKQAVIAQDVLCWAAKWVGKPGIMFDSVHQSTTTAMLKGIHKLLDEADVVVHFYGKRFDVPMLNSEFVKHGMLPPSPFKQIDLKQVVRENFRFPSNKLEYVAKALGIGEKITKNITFDLWTDCIAGDDSAWKRMERYNRQDTALLERLYEKLKPWIRNHPNHGAHTGKLDTCPTCGGTHLQRRGTRVVRLLRYPQYQCQDCGTWFRSNQALPNRKKVYRNVGI